MLSKLLKVFSISKQSCEGNSIAWRVLGRYSLLRIALIQLILLSPSLIATVEIYDRLSAFDIGDP